MKRQPKDWQKDPMEVETDEVQFWQDGVMITLMTRDAAQDAVRIGRAFVINSQAIGAMSSGQMRS